MPPSPSPSIQSLCLALPAYNESAVIRPLLEQAVATLSAMAGPWAIVVVDDGSRDATAALVEQFIAEGHPQVRLIRHEKNRGLGPAIITGLQAALEAVGGGSEAMIVCMDADLTHPPATIPAMRQALDAGADLVIASRFQSASRQVGVPLFRLALSVAARLIFHFYLGLPGVRDYTCGFRALRASLVAAGFQRFGAGLITRSGFACTDELLVHLATLGPVLREVPFTLRYDLKAGRSKMNLGVTVIETLKLLHAYRGIIRRHRPPQR